MKRRAAEDPDFPVYLFTGSASLGGAPIPGNQQVRIVREIDADTVEVMTQDGYTFTVSRTNLEKYNPRKERAKQTMKEAIREGDAELVEYYLEVEGIEPTPFIMGAASKGNASILKLLLRKGGDPNASNSGGISALRFCSTVTCNVKCVNILLEAGARDDNALLGAVRTAISSLLIQQEDEDARQEEVFQNAMQIAFQLRSFNPSTLDEARALVQEALARSPQPEKLRLLEQTLA